MFGSIHHGSKKHGINDVVIISHGVTIRAFVMMWLKLSPEWFEDEPNPKNCGVRFIDGQNDRNYIFEGYQ
jgi:broad specificity phosphatase PhoE